MFSMRADRIKEVELLPQLRRKDGSREDFNLKEIGMKKVIKVCSLFCFVGWTLLCLAAATGAMEVNVIKYCIATGVLALTNMADLVM